MGVEMITYFILIEEGCLSQLESVSEEIVTALLEYIWQIRKMLQ